MYRYFVSFIARDANGKRGDEFGNVELKLERPLASKWQLDEEVLKAVREEPAWRGFAIIVLFFQKFPI